MRRRRPIDVSIGIATIFSVVVCAAPRTARAQATPLGGLDDYVESAMEDWNVPGLAISVVRNDSVIFERGYGVRELGSEGAVDGNTLFAIASTTKAFTVAALGMLVDEGKLSWDDPVTRDLPGFEVEDPWVTREIRVRDLLTHRAGVARDDNLWIAAPFDRAEIIHHLRYLPQVTSFRSRYGYNNLMFITAGEIVGRVSGMGWDDFVAQRIFVPLDMTRSTTRAAVVEERANVSSSHAPVDGTIQVVPRRDYDDIGGAGAIWSSVHDMAQWVRMHLNGGTYGGKRLLSDSALAEMYTPQTLIPIDSVTRRMFPDMHLRAYGLGWDVQDYHGRTLIDHSGSINYTRTQVGMIPSERIGVVVIANLSSSDLQIALMYRILDALMGEKPVDWNAEYLTLARRSEARAAHREQELEASRLQGTTLSLPLDAYAGTYSSDLWGDLTVTHEGSGLVLHYSPDFVADLEHWHHDIFRAKWRRAGDGRSFATFALDERGRIVSVDLEDFGTFRRKR
ncbi:MAG: serine hydrolase [Gemmatimonadetes bacterium]|nr:serine hydrolase [Gemmatimonadota bacterium]